MWHFWPSRLEHLRRLCNKSGPPSVSPCHVWLLSAGRHCGPADAAMQVAADVAARLLGARLLLTGLGGSIGPKPCSLGSSCSSANRMPRMATWMRTSTWTHAPTSRRTIVTGPRATLLDEMKGFLDGLVPLAAGPIQRDGPLAALGMRPSYVAFRGVQGLALKCC